MRIIGLDLSLASTGIAGYEVTTGTGKAWVATVKTKPGANDRAQLERLRHIKHAVLDHVLTADLVVVESLAQHSQTGQHLTRAGLWHLVVEHVDDVVAWCEVGTAALKKFATGKGNAGKDQVLAAVIRRYPDVEVSGNDEADALVLAAMAAHHYQVSTLPTVPQAHATALAKVAWPELKP